MLDTKPRGAGTKGSRGHETPRTNGGRPPPPRRSLAQAAAEKAAFDEAAKKEAADIAAREAKAKAALEPLAKARKRRAATCEAGIKPDGARPTGLEIALGPVLRRQRARGRVGLLPMASDSPGREVGLRPRLLQECQAMCAARQAYTKDGDVAGAGGRRAAARRTARARPGSDRGCGDEVPAGASGYCECHDGTRALGLRPRRRVRAAGRAVHLGLAYPDRRPSHVVDRVAAGAGTGRGSDKRIHIGGARRRARRH